MSGSISGQLSGVERLDRKAVLAVNLRSGSSVDAALHGLSVAANEGRLWLMVAGALALRPGAPRQAAVQGLVALGAAAAVNGTLKAVLPFRPRPQHLPWFAFWPREYDGSSLPSGHTASAAAFTTGVALVSPALATAVAPLAAGVAYSRVHIGAHWPSDVFLGTVVGVGAALASSTWRRKNQQRRHAPRPLT